MKKSSNKKTVKSYIYIATNPDMPNWIKFGRSSKHPKERLYQLSQSTPSYFKLEKYWSMPYFLSLKIERIIKRDYECGWVSEDPITARWIRKQFHNPEESPEDTIWASDFYDYNTSHKSKEWFCLKNSHYQSPYKSHYSDEYVKHMMIKVLALKILEEIKYYRKTGLLKKFNINDWYNPKNEREFKELFKNGLHY